MTILDVNSVTKRFESDPIFTRVSFKVNRGEKVGLIGENGCGKSTLLKMIAGVETPTDGVVTRPGNSSVGYLAQHLEYGEGNTVYEELLGVFDDVRAIGRKLADLEAEMSDPDVSADPARLQRTMDRYGRLSAEFERLGGYAFEHRIDAMMEGLRISALRDQPVHTLSGGEKNITALARILLQQPHILLLDEPANHLDFAGLAWLEEFLRNYSKTVILVSHNRYLLDRVVERIIEIEDGKIAEYRGNYSAYRAEKLKGLLLQKHAFDDQQKEIRRLEEMIKRFEHWAHITSNARHARQARNKQKMLDKMEKVERPTLDRKRIEPHFDVSGKSGRIALELRGYSRAFGDQVLFADIDLHLSYGERVGLLGANGSGKTTLFEDIVRRASWDDPVLRIGPQVRIGYYAQEHDTLDPERTVIDEIRHSSGLSRDRAFSVLSRFLFSWEEVDKRIATLSGGEKSRVQFAKLMVSDANFLLLDEPTNHLDIPSREQVEEALEEFEGTLLVISHDRYFLDRAVDRIVEIDNPGLRHYAGNFSYFWEKRRAAAGAETGSSNGRPARRKSAAPGRRRAVGAGPPDAETSEIETRIEDLEARKLQVERDLATAYRDRDYKRGDRLTQSLRRMEAEIEALYAAWESSSG